MKRNRLLLVVLLAAVFLVAGALGSPAWATGPYGDAHAWLWSDGAAPGTDLGTLGGSVSAAWAINKKGLVVGYSYTTGDTECHAFLWERGTMTDLGTLGGTISVARAINDRGDITGTSTVSADPATSGIHVFLYRFGKMTDITPGFTGCYYNVVINNSGEIAFDCWDPTRGVVAYLWDGRKLVDLGRGYREDINDKGIVVGQAFESSGTYMQAAMWRNATPQILGALGGTYSRAHSLNEKSQVVGWSNALAAGPGLWINHAFLYQSGKMNDLGTLPGGQQSDAWLINDKGLIVGVADTANGVGHAVVWSNGTVRDLGALNGHPWSLPWDINAGGTIVGTSGDNWGAWIGCPYRWGPATNGVPYHAVIWTPGATAPTDLGGGSSYSEALSVNDKNDVVGYLYPTVTAAESQP